MNKLDVEVNPQEVEVTVPVEKVGKSVPVKIKQEGTPESDIEISSMTPDKSEVVVVGDDAVLEKIKEIEIPIDVSKIKADTVKEVTVPVPTGAKSVQPTTIEVKIKTVKSLKQITIKQLQIVITKTQIQRIKTPMIQEITIQKFLSHFLICKST